MSLPARIGGRPLRELIDTVARVCADDDPRAVAELYDLDEFTVPAELIV